VNLAKREQILSRVLAILGVVFVVGLWPLTVWLPGAWMWEPRHPEYEQMILVIYAVLGFFLMRASRHPSDHRSLISFTAWSSLAHGGIMLVHALKDSHERANLFGDVPVLLLIGALLLWLSPRRDEVSSTIR